MEVNAVTRQPLSRLAAWMSMANKANGAVLALTGLLGFFGAFSTIAGDMLSSALLSIYVGGFGGLLLFYEIGGSGMELRRDFGFMYTYLGRTAFLLLIGNLAWPCDPLGFVAALLTNANALFAAYVMVAHPTFTQGHASWVAIGGTDSEGTEMMTTPGSGSSVDPSTQARRAIDASEVSY